MKEQRGLVSTQESVEAAINYLSKKEKVRKEKLNEMMDTVYLYVVTFISFCLFAFLIYQK